MNIKCEFCHYETSETRDSCEHCGRPSRYPNVIAANKEEEKEVIINNYDKTLATAVDKSVLQNFEEKVNKSRAILVRPISEACTLFTNLDSFHQTFHQRLRSGSIRMDEKGYDEHRPSVDAALFPNYSDKITFSALSLNNLGAIGYGGCHMVLKPSMVEYRSTIFKGNSYHILRDEGKVAKSVPKGLRTTWALRGKLAVTKLANSLKTTNQDFQSILINDKDFIEIHIYGSISHRTISEVTVLREDLDKSDTEKLFAEILRKKICEWDKSINDWDTKFTEV